MREIKFRGKRKEDDKWVYGYYVFINNVHLIIYENESGQRCEDEVNPETVGQGFKLNTKSEIFEGDVIDHRHSITFVDGSDNSNTGMNIGLYHQRDDFESWSELEVGDNLIVKGNIFDNPGLLKR